MIKKHQEITRFIAALTLLIVPFITEAKYDKTEGHFTSKFEGGYIVGLQVYNDNFLYTPGYSLHFSHDYRINETVHAGLGAGYVSMDKVDFIPVYGEIVGYGSKKNNAPFINFQLGYAFAQGKETRTSMYYSTKGGTYFNAGFGRKWRLSDGYSLSSRCSYTHQFASLEYKIFGQTQHTQFTDYSSLMFSLGILIH